MWELAIYIAEWVITLLVVLFYLFIRCVVLIIRVFARFGWQCQPLKTSFLVFLGCCGVSMLLLVIHSAAGSVLFPVFVGVGFVQLAITAKVIEVTNADVFLKEPETLITQVLHSNWFK